MPTDPRTKEEEWRNLIQRAQDGEACAKEELVKQNSGLIHMVVRRFASYGKDPEELFQVGAIGLILAINRFDLNTGFAFSTYAVPMIIGEIQRFLREDQAVHVSRQIRENSRKIQRMREEFRGREGREPRIQEIEQETELGREEIVMALESAIPVDSFSRPIGLGTEAAEGGRLTVGDCIEDERCGEREVLDSLAVRQMLESLEEPERKLVTLRYMEHKTQTQVAQILGMNQVAVSRAEKRILKKLREQWEG